jgi:methionine synthase I (cobalamin-dependent)
VSRFLERLHDGPVIVADGGLGALLGAAVPRLRCPEEANLKAPEAVVNAHLGYVRAGAELIETNTFGANRRKLAARLLDDRLVEIVEGGVKLAREAREVRSATSKAAPGARTLSSSLPRSRVYSTAGVSTSSWSRRSSTWRSSQQP